MVVSSTDKDHRSQRSIDRYGGYCCRTYHTENTVCTTICGRLSQISLPEQCPIQGCRVLVTVPRTPIDYSIGNHGLGEDHPPSFDRPVHLKVGSRGRIDNGFGSIETAALVVSHIGGPIAGRICMNSLMAKIGRAHV